MEVLLKKILDLIVNFFSLPTAEVFVSINKMPMPHDRGEHVLILQKQLNKVSGSQIAEDGAYGLQTKTAIGRFQKSKGLSGSGVLGPKTLSLLNLKIVDNQSLSTDLSTRERVYKIAVGEIGQKEMSGAKHNDRILEYHSTTGQFSDDETSWCGSFVSWCLAQGGLETLGARGASARAWLTYGKKTNSPTRGDLVIFWRKSPTSWQGHVGFYVDETKTHIRVLGGNQGDAVNIKLYSKAQFLGYVSFN